MTLPVDKTIVNAGSDWRVLESDGTKGLTAGTWVTSALKGGWSVAHRVETSGTDPRIVETRLRPSKGARPLGSRVLRSVRLTGWEHHVVGREPGRPRLVDPEVADTISQRAGSRKRLRGAMRQSVLANVALGYATATQLGYRNINEVLAEELGMSVKWVTDRVAEARKVGFLTSTKQGRGGGSATPACIEVWERDTHRMKRLSDAAQAQRSWVREQAEIEGVELRTHGDFIRWWEWRVQQPDSPWSRDG